MAEKVQEVYPVKGGWHAAGKGWAVFGRTREEALAKFVEADRKHDEIMARGASEDRRFRDDSRR